MADRDDLQQPPADHALPAGPDPGDVLCRLIENALGTLGGSGGMILLWDPARRAQTELGSHGMTSRDRHETADLLRTSLPDRLVIRENPDDDVPARLLPGMGWQIADEGREAHLSTDRGPLHLVVFPVNAPPSDAGGAADASTDRHSHAEGGGEDGDGIRLPGRPVGLLVLFHPDQQIDLHARHPGVISLIAEQVDLVLMNAQLLRNLLSEARWLEAVLQHTAEGLVILDPRGRVLGCNRAFERLIGWPASDLWGRDLAAMLDIHNMRWLSSELDEEPWEGGEAIAQAVVDQDGVSGPSPRVYELVLTTRGGSQIYTEARLSPIRIDAAALQGAVVSFRDVTAEKEAEELQATFLSVISHELQTPLAVIRGYAELLADSGPKMKPARLQEKLGIIAEESERLSSMVAKLLDASRIQAGGLELSPEPVDIGHLVRRVVQKIQPLTDRHQFIVGISADLPAVLADYERIEQVLTNLVENAVKYSPSGGRITITAEQTSEDVIVHVSDEGIGVPEAERRRIFSRFARLDSRVVRQMKGVGLGLYIARAIVLAHGGRIWVDAAPGGGARFSFSLPRQFKAPLPVLFRRG